ncbi:MAG: hypothetical protein JSU98_08460 [Gemmatimonadales bacterium]|nr:MAG: hypothetical protein JSU98_08460 [Gemmatimonadales bacterium]
MSTSEVRDDLMGLEALAASVARALKRIRALETDLEAIRARNSEVEDLLQRMTTGEESPARMVEQLRALQTQNGDIRERLEKGLAVTDRLLARVRYLEEHG